MVLDYHERKVVNKNRPKKKGNGLVIAIAVAALGATFALGFGFGWTVGKAARKPAPVAQAGAGEAGVKSAAPAPAPPPDVTGNAGGVEPPLTFYNTLPKGGKTVIGSGLNPHKPQEKQPEPKPSPPPAAASQPAGAAAAPPVAGREQGGQQKGSGAEAPPAEKKPAAGKGKFIVQVASSREKGEAEAIRDRLLAKGAAAYVVESHVADKGVWYRVRVGKGLSQQEAKDAALKVGKEALVIPE